jgi:hypothetical protein
MRAAMEPTPERRTPAGPRPLRVVVARRRDDGAVIEVECRRCGHLIDLDPRRMQQRKVGVFLVCAHCECRFLVRRTDVDRPAPPAAGVPLDGGTGSQRRNAAGRSPRPDIGVGSRRRDDVVGGPPRRDDAAGGAHGRDDAAGGSGPDETGGSPGPTAGSSWRGWTRLFSRWLPSSRRGSGR